MSSTGIDEFRIHCDVRNIEESGNTKCGIEKRMFSGSAPNVWVQEMGHILRGEPLQCGDFSKERAGVMMAVRQARKQGECYPQSSTFRMQNAIGIVASICSPDLKILKPFCIFPTYFFNAFPAASPFTFTSLYEANSLSKGQLYWPSPPQCCVANLLLQPHFSSCETPFLVFKSIFELL